VLIAELDRGLSSIERLVAALPTAHTGHEFF